MFWRKISVCRWQYFALAALVLFSSCCAALQAEEAARELDTGPQIFVDDLLLARTSGVVRRAHACEKLAEPVIVSKETWEQSGDDRRVYVYGTVLRDPETGGFRLWYNRGHLVLYATSDDGLSWQRPRLGLHEFGGSTENNIVLPHFHSPSVVYDKDAVETKYRYQMLGCASLPRRAYYAAHSADGIHWELHPKNPVLSGSDTCTLAFDSETGAYLAFHKLYREHRGVKRRLVYLATSRDMQEWSKPALVMAPDDEDDAQVRAEGGRFAQFYNMSVFPYAGQFLGFVTHFRYSGPPERKGPLQSGHDGPVDVQLVHSRNGREWHRCEDRSPVIPLGPDAYDAGCILGVCNGVVRVGDEIWTYYTAITTTHGGFVPEKEISIGRAAWRLDGLVSLDAEGEGVVETVPLGPVGSHLVVNADASGGEMRVEVLDAEGHPIPGFGREECAPLSSDSVRHTVHWKDTDSLPSGSPLRLRFCLTSAKLYSFRVER